MIGSLSVDSFVGTSASPAFHASMGIRNIRHRVLPVMVVYAIYLYHALYCIMRYTHELILPSPETVKKQELLCYLQENNHLLQEQLRQQQEQYI
jgi:hypothetical protein